MRDVDGPLVQRFGGAVVIQGRALKTARWLVRVGADAVRRADGIDTPALAALLVREFEAAIRESPEPTSDTGSSEVPTGTDPRPLVMESRISTSEAATILDRTSRQVLNLRDRIGGHKIGGRWTFDAELVRQHAALRRSPSDDRRARS